jgi:hypothetical protein
MNKIRKFQLAANTTPLVYGLGVLTDEPDYRLCWLLNRNYPWDLVRSADIVTNDENLPSPQSYSCFESSSNHKPAIKLISNRSNEGIWMTKYRQVDFLLMAIDQDSSAWYLDELKNTLGAKIPQIRGLFKVPLPSFCYL